MPTFTLSKEDCEAFRLDMNGIVHALESAAQSSSKSPVPWLIPTEAGPRFTRLRNRLNDAVTVGTFDPVLALGVLERVSKSGPENPVVFTRTSHGPEMLEHVERLAGLGLFTLTNRNNDRSMVGTSSGLHDQGKRLLDLLRTWDFSTPAR